MKNLTQKGKKAIFKRNESLSISNLSSPRQYDIEQVTKIMMDAQACDFADHVRRVADWTRNELAKALLLTDGNELPPLNTKVRFPSDNATRIDTLCVEILGLEKSKKQQVMGFFGTLLRKILREEYHLALLTNLERAEELIELLRGNQESLEAAQKGFLLAQSYQTIILLALEPDYAARIFLKQQQAMNARKRTEERAEEAKELSQKVIAKGIQLLRDGTPHREVAGKIAVSEKFPLGARRIRDILHSDPEYMISKKNHSDSN